MSRLIDADRLIETIRQHHYMLADRFNSQDWGMFTIGIEEAIDIQPTINEWIPVSEPPKVNGNYFIAYQYRRGGIGAAEIPTDTETMHYASAFYGNARWDIEHHLVCEVIAWMPIPTYEANND